MTYESSDEIPVAAERRAQRDLRMVGGRGHNNPTVAVVAEVVWRQPTSPSDGKHKDSLLGLQRATINGINC